MRLLAGFLMLALALAISSVAAYFSVVGLAALFAATAGAVVIMGVALEAGKLATAGWVHAHWHNKKVNVALKCYLVASVIALMLITSLGIYGFLAKGHLEQSTPLAPVELQIASLQADIDTAKADMTSQQQRLAQMDAAVNSMIGKDNAAQGLRYRRSQASERAEIQNAIKADNDKIAAITKELVPLKLQVNEVETKLGPVKYVADLFGMKDTESAVRIVIMIIMFAFDPLAVVMVLASIITISDAIEERRRLRGPKFYEVPREEPVEPTPEPEPTKILITPDIDLPVLTEDQMIIFAEPSEPALELSQDPEPVPTESEDLVEDDGDAYAIHPDGTRTPVEDGWQQVPAEPDEIEQPANLLVELEQAKPKTDKEMLLEIFERQPDLLQDIVEAIRDQNNGKVEIDDSWLEAGPDKNESWLDSGPAK